VHLREVKQGTRSSLYDARCHSLGFGGWHGQNGNPDALLAKDCFDLLHRIGARARDDPRNFGRVDVEGRCDLEACVPSTKVAEQRPAQIAHTYKRYTLLFGIIE